MHSNRALVPTLTRRSFLQKTVAGAAVTAAASIYGCPVVQPHLPSPTAYRAVYEVEDFWGMLASREQVREPVTTGWTWGHYDLWQVPRRERGIIGPSAFPQGAMAITVTAGGELWQQITVPYAGTYRLFLRVVNYQRDGTNAVTVTLG